MVGDFNKEVFSLKCKLLNVLQGKVYILKRGTQNRDTCLSGLDDDCVTGSFVYV